jgi:hypothetical protein
MTNHDAVPGQFPARVWAVIFTILLDLGHRNITHTVRYTELRSDRFDGFWKD